MKVYEAIEVCTISYREYDKIDMTMACPANDFILYPGDFFFIESAGWVPTENGKFYREINKLTKIYHNKLIDFDGKKEWTWVNNLDVINPKVDSKYLPQDVLHRKLKDVTQMWNREMKLKELGV